MFAKVCKLVICLGVNTLCAVLVCNLMLNIFILLEIVLGYSTEFVIYSTGALYACIVLLLAISIFISFIVEGIVRG